jgi:ABC-type nitrate/sulfonate/bicarbonate transport system substrate-binding protein
MKMAIWSITVLLYSVFIGFSPSIAAEPSKLLIAHGAISNNVAPLWIAKEQGIFRKYGIEADLVFIIAGRAMQAMLAGQVPVGLVGGTHVTNANTGGGDFAMILGLENKLDYIFVAKPTIKGAEDLKGKKVAIGTPAGSASLATYVSLDHLGLVPRRDQITLLGIGGVPERMGALRSGSVEATSLSPEIGQVVVSEGYRVLVDLGKENVPFQSSGLVVPRSLIKTNPQLVENIAKATVEGAAFVHKPANKEIVLRSLGRNLRLDRPDRVEKAYQGLLGALPRQPCPSTEGIVAMLKLMAQHGLNAKASHIKPDEIADMSYCKRFEDSGFFRSLY